MSKKKKMFEVEENETIAQCLERMQKEGYMPVRRMEEPIFKEEIKEGKKEYLPIGRKIRFEGRRLE